MNYLLKLFCALLVLFICLAFLSSVSSILLPFVTGIILAYFLDPAADKLEQKGFSRTSATIIILMSFIFAIGMLGYFMGPILYAEAKAFALNVPNYIKKFEVFATPYINIFYERIGHSEDADNINFLAKITEYSLNVSQAILANVIYSSIAFINLFSLLIITPIVTFYLLRDWDLMLSASSKLMPKKFKKDILQNFRAIDQVLSAYIRGQTNVCLLLGIFYAFFLSLIGLNHGFLIGFLTGIFSFIPYFGVIIGMAIGIAVAIFQFDSYVQILGVLLIFIIGQFVEGNFVTPKFVGDKIGIHPVLIIFSLLSGAALFGFLGILFAIPAIAIIGVLTKFFVKIYKRSNFFLAK